MTFHRLLITLLIGAMVSLAPLAQASPPDQSWLGGWFDDADYDDVVLAITSAVGVIDSETCHPTGVVHTVVAFIILDDERPVATASLSSASTRAPPSAA